MFSTIQNTAISILVYFLVVFLSYGLSHLLKKRCKSEEYLKITRDVFKTIFFLALLVYFQISTAISFAINVPLLVIYGVIVIVFLFVFTKKESNEFVILGTVVFIVFHFAFDVKSIVYFFCIAFLLFGLRMQSGSVLNSMLLHSMINFIIIYRK